MYLAWWWFSGKKKTDDRQSIDCFVVVSVTVLHTHTDRHGHNITVLFFLGREEKEKGFRPSGIIRMRRIVVIISVSFLFRWIGKRKKSERERERDRRGVSFFCGFVLRRSVGWFHFCCVVCGPLCNFFLCTHLSPVKTERPNTEDPFCFFFSLSLSLSTVGFVGKDVYLRYIHRFATYYQGVCFLCIHPHPHPHTEIGTHTGNISVGYGWEGEVGYVTSTVQR